MPYLMRMTMKPDIRQLSTQETDQLNRVFDVYSTEVRIHGEPVGWNEIDEVELVTAPTVRGIASWLLGLFVNTDERYHVGLYLGRDEAVIPNVTRQQALYVLHTVAYYAPQSVRYTGPDGIVPLAER